eukprot:scaffold13254_cov51-Phaeocystis_antarctica.AAC.1
MRHGEASPSSSESEPCSKLTGLWRSLSQTESNPGSQAIRQLWWGGTAGPGTAGPLFSVAARAVRARSWRASSAYKKRREQSEECTSPQGSRPRQVLTTSSHTVSLIGNQHALHDLGLTAASDREAGFLGFHRRSTGKRRSPIEARGRLLELRCRARPRPPSTPPPTQHQRPHAVCNRLVRRRPHNPRRQRLEPLVVPPLRLGHLGALLMHQHVEGICRGFCPVQGAHRIALPGLEVPRRGLHLVTRVGERCTEVEDTPRARRASGRWPRGRSWLPCASHPSSRTARPLPAASSTRRPTARRAGPAPPRPHAAAAASPRHPLASSAASSPSCETHRASAKRQGSPGSPRRRGTSSAASHRGTYRRWGASHDRRPCLTAAGSSRCKRGSAPQAKACRPRRQRAARPRRPCQPRSRPSAPPAPRGPPWWPLPGLVAAPEAWRAAA